ncbi:MAG: hypothetical protein IJY23_02125 [Clostridia bacterium]|nr:hypothetical protein [Clostridia bacterium]
MKRKIQSLNGVWDFRIADGDFTKKIVPYSELPVGFAECRLCFDKLDSTSGKRAFLVFDGITYQAEVTLNGKKLGSMLPYSEYRYEITDIIKDTDNFLNVSIRDTDVVFGPAEGWENYSGINRDVYIEYTEDYIFESVFWHAELSDDLTLAECSLEIKTNKDEKDGYVKITLSDASGLSVYEGDAPIGDEKNIHFTVANPSLWSPDTPTLYRLNVALCENGVCSDEYECRVGFKKLEIKGKRFYLNKEPFFFLGVCRHDLYGDKGHLLTEDDMYSDFKMIKETGANYVRLVHYPHHKRTLEIADEIGLLVSEEPGLWFNDVTNEEIFSSSLEVLRRVVLRDRNHISVAFWLSFNECEFTPEYLRASAAVCRENDPYRMVSGANCMGEEITKEQFSACNLDFYTMHPYTFDVERLTYLAKYFDDKPLVFTEWGGYFVYDNLNLLKTFIRRIVSLWQNPDDAPVLAGASIWCWAGVYEFNRAAPACYDGVLCEGLVDNHRQKNVCFDVFVEEFRKIKAPQKAKKNVYKTEFSLPGVYTPLTLEFFANSERQMLAWEEMMREARKPIPRFHYNARRLRIMKNGPTLPEKITALGELKVELLEKPLVINSKTPLVIPVKKIADEICFIGNVSMPKGFPIDAPYGEVAATLTITYQGDESESIPLRNGKEITTAAGWYGPSRINPVASNAERALTVINDMDREHYVVNLFRIKTKNAEISNITIGSVSEGYHLLLYGISLK